MTDNYSEKKYVDDCENSDEEDEEIINEEDNDTNDDNILNIDEDGVNINDISNFTNILFSVGNMFLSFIKEIFKFLCRVLYKGFNYLMEHIKNKNKEIKKDTSQNDELPFNKNLVENRKLFTSNNCDNTDINEILGISSSSTVNEGDINSNIPIINYNSNSKNKITQNNLSNEYINKQDFFINNKENNKIKQRKNKNKNNMTDTDKLCEIFNMGN